MGRSSASAKAAPKAAAAAPTKTAAQKTTKTLYDHFQGWTNSATHVRVSPTTGKTLRDTIYAEWERVLGGGKPRWGTLYYQELREEFAAECSITRRLTPDPPPGFAPDMNLLRALAACKATPPKRGPFSVWLQTVADRPQQPTVVAAFREAAKLRLGCKKQILFAKQVLEFVVRHSIDRHFPDTWCIMKEWADRVLLQLWISAHSSHKYSPREWAMLEDHTAMLGLVADLPAVRKVLAVQDTKWQTVEAELAIITKSSKVCQELWGGASSDLTATRVDAVIAQRITQLANSGQVLTKLILLDAKQKILAEIAALPNAGALDRKRQSVGVYRGIEYTRSVDGFANDVSFRIACLVKSLCVEQKHLRALWCEDVVVMKPKSVGDAVVDAALAAPADLARKSCGVKFAKAAELTTESLVELVTNCASSYLAVDSDWAVEQCMMASLTGTDAGSRLIAATLEEMPSETKAVDIQAAALRMQWLATQKVYQFAGTDTQAKCDCLARGFGRIADGRAPDFTGISGDEPFRPVMTRLQYFVRIETKDNAGQVVPKFGADALFFGYENAKTDFEAGKHVHGWSKLAKTYMFLMPNTAYLEEVQQFLAKIDSKEMPADSSSAGNKKGRPTKKNLKRSISAASDCEDEVDAKALKAAMKMFE